MNAKFTFPRPQPAVPRPTPAAIPSSPSALPDLAGSRTSNALRASILDTALELGIGSNSLVADWMFNDPVIEEVEEEQEPTPSLTYGSPTSEESTLSPSSSLLHSQYRREPIVHAIGNGLNTNLNPNVNKNGPLIFQRRDLVSVGSGRISDADSTLKASFNSNGPALNFNVSKFQTISLNDSAVAVSDIPIPPRPTTPSGRKLRKKKRAGGDGYESDGGYVSETGKKKDKKKGNSGEDVKQRLKEDKLEEEKKKKSFVHINKISTTNDIQPPTNKGLETNSDAVSTSLKSKSKTKKSKTNSSEIGYETDGGYQSSSSALKKSKTRFFKLPSKSSKGDLRVEANKSVPALPTFPEKKSEPVVPLPIAERFATTLTPNFTVSLPMPSPTTKMEGGRGSSPLPPLAFQPFPASSELTSTLSPSPVSPGPSTFNPVASAPPSNSPSAFNTSVAHLHLKNRDSHSSVTSSSSSCNSGSIQHQKSQKRTGLFSPPPSSMHSHQQHSLRTASSLSSLKRPPPVISLPITRPTSPTSAGLQPSPPHSRSVSHLPPFVSPPPTTSVAPLQINKNLRTKPLLDRLSLRRSSSPTSSGIGGSLSTPSVSLSETPSPGLVRPRNPPTDGFGPRPAPTPDSVSPIPPTPVFSSNSNNDGLFPPSHTQGHLRQTSSQLSIVPSSDYIVPSPRNSPSKPHPPSPNVLAAYYHHDYIPPPPNPAPMGPLPILPSGGNISPAVVPPNGNSSGSATAATTTTSQIIPSVSQLRQRMTLMRPSVQHDNGIGLNTQRGREPPFPPRPVQSTVDNAGGSRRYPDVYNGVGSGVDDTAKLQEKRSSKQSWVDIDEDTLDERENPKGEEDQEAEEPDEPDDLYGILDRFDDEDSDDLHHSSSGGNALERSMSYTAGKKDGQQPHPNGFEARPRENNKIPADVVAHDNQIYSFEDDGKTTVGDRTSRWSGSVYSRSSLLDEGESEETRDRFVRRVEAMLDADKKAKREAQAAQVFVPPPLPKIPDAYSKNIVHHRPNGRNIINQNAGIHSNITTTATATATPGRSWIKF